MANKTVGDIQGFAQDLLRLDGSDLGLSGIEEARTIEWINDLNAELYEEFYSRGLVVPDYLASSVGFDTSSATALAADTAAGATSLTVDSSAALDSSGAAVIYDRQHFDVFTYTGNSSGTVSGIPASGRDSLEFAHDDDDAVEKLYALPSDFGRPRPGRIRGDGLTMDGVPFYERPEFPQLKHFSIYTDTSESKHLWLPRGSNGQASMFYDLKPSTLDSTDDEIDWPSPYHWYLVYGLVGLYKQVLEASYVPDKEMAQMTNVVNKAIKKRSAGKRIIGNQVFFRRA